MYYSMLDAVGFLLAAMLLFAFSFWLAGYFFYAAFFYYREWNRSNERDRELEQAAAPPAELAPVERKRAA